MGKDKQIRTLTDVIKFINEYWEYLEEGDKIWADILSYPYPWFSDDNTTSTDDFTY